MLLVVLRVELVVDATGVAAAVVEVSALLP